MNNKLFTKKGELFLQNQICTCIDDLTNKILKEALEEVDFFNKLIDYYLTINFPYNSENDLDDRQQEENRKVFEEKLSNWFNNNILEEDSNAKKIYDEISHLLRSYSSEGLKGVWCHREASQWYPKIIINKNIGSRDEINKFDDIITIYRGTSKDEFDSNCFGQAWSLSKDIAKGFAFEYYKNSPNYINTIRIVVQAKINKNDVFYYRKGHIEAEVVINTLKLLDGTIKLIEKQVLENKE